VDDSLKRHLDLLHQSLRDAGRDPGTFGIDPWISIKGMTGEDVAMRVDAWRNLGATHIAVDTMRAGFTSPQAHIDAIHSFRRVIQQ